MKLLKLAFMAVVIGMLATAATGCKKKTVPGSTPEIGASVKPPTAGGGIGDEPLNQPLKGHKGGIKEVAIPEWPKGDPSTIVYFDFDKCDIKASEQPKLEKLAKVLEKYPTYAVRAEGNCDERGSAEYNRGLGQRRAETIRNDLVKLGVAETRIDTLSNGLEKPAVKDAKSEAEHAQNRRGEFVIGTREE